MTVKQKEHEPGLQMGLHDESGHCSAEAPLKMTMNEKMSN